MLVGGSQKFDEFETPVGNVFGVEIITNTISRYSKWCLIPMHGEMLVAAIMLVIFGSGLSKTRLNGIY